MAFVDEDDAEGVVAIVLGEKAGKALLIVQTQGLIGGNLDAGVPGRVAALFGPDDAGIVAEGGLELGVGLLP